MSRYPVTTDAYAEFLNDAESNPDNERGQYLVFSNDGSVQIDTGATVYNAAHGRLFYNPSSPIGERYTVYSDYHNHPITGVSTIGAMKYCNWLTITIRGDASERCYTEGSSPSDWHPVTVTFDEWISGGFSDAQRLEWAQLYSGYRLPMDHRSDGVNYYNEYYKAAAWSGSNNTTYAFGRNTISGADANYANSGDPYEEYAIATTPVGFYNGSLHNGYQTNPNSNYYGIYDLTGNVDEFTSDVRAAGQLFLRGGGWSSGPVGNNGGVSIWMSGGGVPALQYTSTSAGFRLVSSFP